MNTQEISQLPKIYGAAFNAQLDTDMSMLIMFGLKGLEDRGFIDIIKRLKLAKVFVSNAALISPPGCVLKQSEDL